jgi:hypothetical protein
VTDFCEDFRHSVGTDMGTGAVDKKGNMFFMIYSL